MKEVMRKAYTEVDEILKYMPDAMVEKVPSKLKKLFHEARLENYKVEINPNLPIEKQKLVYETLVILTILKINYWCDSEEEKEKLKKQLIENDKKLEDRYDISKLNNNLN